MVFKEPGIINKPKTTWNGANAVGYIEKITRRNEVGAEVVEDFLKEVKTGSGISYLFQANLRCGDTIIKIQAWSSDNNPTRAKDFADRVVEGDYVKVRGKFVQREYKGNRYSEINIFELNKTTEKESPEAYVATQLQGTIDYIDFEEDENVLKLLIKMKRFNSDNYDDYLVAGEMDNPYVKWLMEKTPAVKEGDVIKVGCDYKNELIEDRYGVIEDVVNRLELGKVYAYHVDESGSGINNGMPF